MILWTIQTEEAWNELNEKGHISGRSDNIEQSWITSYRWMVEQMKERLDVSTCESQFPIWAWYQWENSERKRPDLRASGHLPKDKKGVRIEFNCHENMALLSDFDLWHYVLNYWYLPESTADDDYFDAELKKEGLSFFQTKPLPHALYHEKIVKSWNKIFDLDWNETDLASAKEKKSIQATLWQLKIDHVRNYKCFKAR